MQPGLELVWLGGGVTASIHLPPGALRLLVTGLVVYWLGSQLWLSTRPPYPGERVGLALPLNNTELGFGPFLPSWPGGGSGGTSFPRSGVEFGFSFFGAVVTVASLLATGALLSSGIHF